MCEILRDQTDRVLKNRKLLRRLAAELTFSCVEFFKTKEQYKEGNDSITIVDYSQKFRAMRNAEKRLISFIGETYHAN